MAKPKHLKTIHPLKMSVEASDQKTGQVLRASSRRFLPAMGVGVVGLVCVSLIGCTAIGEKTADGAASVRKAAEQATSVPSGFEGQAAAADIIKEDVSWLADDARKGREAGTAGYMAAATFVADTLKSLDVKPGNGDSYFQNVSLRITQRDDGASYLVIMDASGQLTELTHKDDYLSGASTKGEAFEVTAPVVFAGYGIEGGGYDSYADLDVRGKIVAVFARAPADMNSEVRAHSGSGRTKAKLAASKGAVGMITFSANTQNPEERWKRVASFPDNGRWGWVSDDGTTSGASEDMAPAFTMGPTGAAALFENAPVNFADLREAAATQTVEAPLKGFDLPVSVTLKGGGLVEDVSSPNVVGIIEGTDPDLKDEVVVLSAHLDHVGVYEPRAGGEDHIHNGAMDNAMGISTLLQVARRFRETGGPRRTVAFVAVTAEEKGLVGSDYFAHYPTFGDKKMVANVNLDMPLVLYPFTDVIAFGADRSSLGQMVRNAGEKIGVTLIDDPYPNLSLFVRSDHYSFVKQGVPSVFLFLGTGNGGQEVFQQFMSTNYHQPSDEVGLLDIQWQDAARFAELNYLIAREIADGDETPAWKEGDFFGSSFN